MGVLSGRCIAAKMRAVVTWKTFFFLRLFPKKIVVLCYQNCAMRSISSLILALLFLTATAQKNKNKFSRYGSITVQDLQKTVYSIDSNANAVVLYDVAESYMENGGRAFVSLVTKRHKVVHILNKNGYELAKEEIRLFSDRDEVRRFKATTYNLNEGKVIATNVDKSSIFVERVNDNIRFQKFTFPQVKEGSIIEYQYEATNENFSSPNTWLFQSFSAPTLYSEFCFDIPKFLIYNFHSLGSHKMDIYEKKESSSNFHLDIGNHSIPVTSYRWAMKNVPALTDEGFTYSLKNHIARIELQLSAVNYPLIPRSINTSWEAIVAGLLKSEGFGEHLKASNSWMAEDIKPIITSGETDLETAKAIYYYIKDNFKCTYDYGLFLSQSLRNVFKSKNGNVAEINLLLTAALRYAGFECHPVLLSTRENGIASIFSPMLKSMNYVVCRVTIGEEKYLLDASKPFIGFGKLPLNCFNGVAIVADEPISIVNLNPITVREEKTTQIFISNLENKKWGGYVRQQPGYYASENIRKRVSEKGKDDFQKELQSEHENDGQVENLTFENLHAYEKPAILSYEFEFNTNGEDIIYFTPAISQVEKKNPFSGSERHYPVEMPYCIDETIKATIEIPEGYEVDEMPSSIKIWLDEDGKSYFEYKCNRSGNILSFLSRIKVGKVYFSPDEYPDLREFYNQIFKKQHEQIVFKKLE